MKRRLLPLLLALVLTLGLAAPALAAETAAVIRLTKTTGTVEISKNSGKSISLLKNMRLYNGYHVSTSEESYAWVNMDDSKLLKEDAESEIEVRKDGKKLEVLLVSGNLFFDVAEPLEDDESLNIRTSTTVVGIRGTSGWIEIIDRWAARVYVLEGTVKCSVADPVTGQLKSEAVQGGEMVICTAYPQERMGDKCDIIRQKYTVDDIPGFVLTDLTRDIPLCDKIEAETGLDIPRDLAAVAGGDPSGRLPSGDSATSEVLGEADRREDEDEDSLHEKLEEIRKEEEKQPDYISPDKVLDQPAPPSDDSDRDSGSDSGGGSGGGSGSDSGGGSGDSAPEAQTRGMKLTDAEVQALLDAGRAVILQPNTDASDTTPKKNTLEVDTGLTVAAGKTLDLQTGIDMEVYQGKTLRVDGTLTADALQNNGTSVVTSGDTLRLRGNLTTAGTLSVSATGRVIVDGTFTRTGTLTLASGAVVMAKRFASGAAPSGWEVSAGADAGGYYTLEPAGTATPGPYSVSFDGNGGAFPTGGAGQTAVQTDETGRIADWPEDPVNTALSPHNSFPFIFMGWYTAAVGGDKIAPDHVFAADTQLYAHWTVNGIDWEYQASDKTIRFYGTGPTGDYPLGYSSATQEISTAPWRMDLGQAETAIIEDGITAIGEGAFATAYGDSFPMELRSVIIPESVTSIGRNAFFRCSITDVTIPDSVTSIGGSAFARCSGLTSVSIPGSVTSIGNSAFIGCTSLAGLTIPEGVATIENAAFESCSSLTSVTIPSTITAMGDSVFGYCSALSSVSISEGAKSLGRNTFNRCTSLASINIPSSVSSIEAGTFSECTGLTSVTFPDSVTSIGDNAFGRCTGLTSVTIPSSVSSVGLYAFDGCSSLTSVTIPNSVTSIGDRAFQYCSALTTINFTGTQEQWNAIDGVALAGIPNTAVITYNYVPPAP